MKAIKKVLLGLALATCAAVNANATALTDSVFVFADTSGPGTLATWTFGEGDPTVQAGDTFTYDFLFNTPPSAPTTSFAYQLKPDMAGDVLFDGQTFNFISGEDVPGFMLSGLGTSVFGSGFVDSGLYVLEVTGTFLANGAGFSGKAFDDITDVSGNVPEPMSLALMGLGLVGLAGARRRNAA